LPFGIHVELIPESATLVCCCTVQMADCVVWQMLTWSATDYEPHCGVVSTD